MSLNQENKRLNRLLCSHQQEIGKLTREINRLLKNEKDIKEKYNIQEIKLIKYKVKINHLYSNIHDLKIKILKEKNKKGDKENVWN